MQHEPGKTVYFEYFGTQHKQYTALLHKHTEYDKLHNSIILKGVVGNRVKHNAERHTVLIAGKHVQVCQSVVYTSHVIAAECSIDTIKT